MPDAGMRSSMASSTFHGDAKQMLCFMESFDFSKEIFLREALRNSSYALDKILHESRTDERKLDDEPELFIRIAPDKVKKALCIIDTGIGMTGSDLVNNFETIERSGTKEFMKILQADDNVSTKGQFGVWFYLAYLVADKVTVTTKHTDDDQYILERLAGTFTVTRDLSGCQLSRGTKITLFLKEEQLEYLEEMKLKDLVKKYSEFVSYPIYLDTETVIGNGEEEVDTKSKSKKMVKGVSLNKNQKFILLWKPDMTKENYASLYKSLTGGYNEPLAIKDFSVERRLKFKALLFVPSRMPFELTCEKRNMVSVKLYARRVFIMECYEELISQYLGFMICVVDLDELPINIFGETLGKKKILAMVRDNLVNKCLEMFAEISEDKEVYRKFYAAFSKKLKLGIMYDRPEKKKLAQLLRYNSTVSGGELTSLKDYIKRMKVGQKEIYFIAGESTKAIEDSPLLERLKTKGYEVLLMDLCFDERVMERLNEFDGKKLISASNVTLKLEETKEEKEGREKLCRAMKNILGDMVDYVVVSNRMIDSPCCVMSTVWQMYARFLGSDPLRRRLLRRLTLEINPDNEIIEALTRRRVLDEDTVMILFFTALVSSGFKLYLPEAFAARIHRMIELRLQLRSTKKVH